MAWMVPYSEHLPDYERNTFQRPNVVWEPRSRSTLQENIQELENILVVDLARTSWYRFRTQGFVATFVMRFSPAIHRDERRTDLCGDFVDAQAALQESDRFSATLLQRFG
jgi:hypothetical protein